MSPERRGMPLTERATAAAFTGPALADDGSADAHPWSGGGGVAGTCGWSAIVPSLDHIQGLTIKLQDSAINITRI
jgi:hypothetical protein